MSLQIFQRWFNIPPWKDAEYITGNHGEKFWIYWRDELEDTAKLRVLYRGRPIGHVNLIEENEKLLTLADICVFEKYHGRGVGKGMMEKIIQWAKENGFQKIWGFIQPNESVTREYLQEWYKRQGFEVYEAKPGVFHVLLKLQSEQNGVSR